MADEGAKLGDLALQNGLISQDQLQEAMAEQKTAARDGQSTHIGQILVRRGWLTTSQLCELLQQQSERATLGDRFEIIEELGQGGMSIVYRARDIRLEREVALKVLRREFAVHKSTVQRMFREAKAIGSLDHPNIVRLFDMGDGKSPYLVMEYVRGRTMSQRMADPAWGMLDRLKTLATVARAVHSAHQKGIVHRDLKPSNVIIEESGRVVVMDFGLAHMINAESDLTRSGDVVGTPQYMAPEQVRGEVRQIDPRTDVYALGAILYEMIVGEAPFKGNLLEVYQKILKELPTPPRTIKPEVSVNLELVCVRAMSKDKRDRYQTAEAFAEDLERFLEGKSVVARLFGPWKRRRRAALKVLAALLVITAIGGSAYGAKWYRDKHILPRQMRAVTQEALAKALKFRSAGDLPGMHAQLAEAEKICGRCIEVNPEMAEPHALLAKIHRVQMRDSAALAEANAALEKDPACAPALYERILMARAEIERDLQDARDLAHWERLRRMKAGLPAVAEPPPGSSHTQMLLDRLSKDLSKIETMRTTLHPGEGQLVHGLQAQVKGDAAKARKHYQECIEALPECIEGYCLLARLENDNARHDEAVQSWTAALKHDRGYIPLLEGRAATLANRALASLQPGQELQLETALGDLRDAINLAQGKHLAQEQAEAYRRRGILNTHLTLAAAELTETFDKCIKEARNDYRKATDLDSGRAANYFMHGAACAIWARATLDHDREPGTLFRDASDTLKEALSRDPQLDLALALRGGIRALWLRSPYAPEQDPSKEYEDIIKEFTRALTLNAKLVNARLGRGQIRADWALYKINKGEKNVGGLPQEALDDFADVLKDNPQCVEALMARAYIHRDWYVYRDLEDPTPHYANAVEDLCAVLDMNKESKEALFLRGSVYKCWALYIEDKDPSEKFQSAKQDFDTLLKLYPSYAEGWLERGRLYTSWGRYTQRKKKDPTEFFKKAVDDCMKALPLDTPTAYFALGNAHYYLASYKKNKNQDAKSEYAAAKEAFEKVKEKGDGDTVENQIQECDDYLKKAR